MAPTSSQIASGSSKTATVWAVVAIVIIAALAWYYYFAPYAGRENGEDAATQALERQGSSDEVSAIEPDLNSTDFTDLDREVFDLDAELAR
jgi:hypothetical protein